MAKTNKTRKTRKANEPRPIPAMLEGGFSTRLENFVADMNNQLAREGKLTTDPAYVMLRTIRRELVRSNVATFERGTAIAETAPAKAPKRPRNKSTAAPATPPADVPASREIEESDITVLAVDGTVSDAAPYGRDAAGVALAPYGVKLNGVPKKRRGRAAVAPQEAPTEEPTVEEPGAPAPEADLSGAEEDEGEEEEDEGEEEEDEGEIDDEDLDDLLAGL